MTSFINSTWVWSNFHFLKDSTLVTFRGHQTLSIFLRTQFVTTFRWYNCNYNSVVHNGHDNGIIKKIEIKMWISKMLSLEFLYLDSTTNTHKNWTKKKQLEKVLWMNESPFKMFGECGKTYVYRRPQEEFSAERLTPTAKQGGGKIQVYVCLTVISVGHIYHIKCFLHQNMYKQILMQHMWPSFAQLGSVNIKSYFSGTITQNIQQSQWKKYTELVQ